jgi:hypothetical protein
MRIIIDRFWGPHFVRVLLNGKAEKVLKAGNNQILEETEPFSTIAISNRFASHHALALDGDRDVTLRITIPRYAKVVVTLLSIFWVLGMILWPEYRALSNYIFIPLLAMAFALRFFLRIVRVS